MDHTATHASPTQLEMDLTPRPDADISKRLIDFLRSEPSAHDVAREIVLQFLAPFDARASVISVIEPDATLWMVGAFGVSHDILDPGFCSIWDEFPSAAAIRTREPILMASAEQCMKEFPGIKTRSTVIYPVVAMPLLTSTSTVGALSVHFGTEGPSVFAAARAMQAIADVYVLSLASRCIDRSSVRSADPHAGSDVQPQPVHSPFVRSAPRADLTKRQHVILRLLREGLTYDQIAARIGYSHSTVREELMYVYRLLDVHSRHEAVVEAIRRKILPSREQEVTKSVSDGVLVTSN